MYVYVEPTPRAYQTLDECCSAAMQEQFRPSKNGDTWVMRAGQCSLSRVQPGYNLFRFGIGVLWQHHSLWFYSSEAKYGFDTGGGYLVDASRLWIAYSLPNARIFESRDEMLRAFVGATDITDTGFTHSRKFWNITTIER